MTNQDNKIISTMWRLESKHFEEAAHNYIASHESLKRDSKYFRVKFEEMKEPIGGADKSYYLLLNYYEEPKTETDFFGNQKKGSDIKMRVLINEEASKQGALHDMLIYHMEDQRKYAFPPEPKIISKHAHSVFIFHTWNQITLALKECYEKNGQRSENSIFRACLEYVGVFDMGGKKCPSFSLSLESEGAIQLINVFPAFINTKEERMIFVNLPNNECDLTKI